MVIQYMPQLVESRIILASASPRRSELLRGLGLIVEVIPSSFSEDLEKDMYESAGSYAQDTARCKADEVSSRLQSITGNRNESKWPRLIVAADTVVELRGRIMEKPRSNSEAVEMLRQLSGQRHQVFTGVALKVQNEEGTSGASRNFYEQTWVDFGKLDDEQIESYVATGEPMDKSGAYGIQGKGSSFVKGIAGCYFNVMGFPIHRFCSEVVDLIKSGELRF